MKIERYIHSWPDSFQERDYRIFEPAESFRGTQSYLQNRGFTELTRSNLFRTMLFQEVQDPYKSGVRDEFGKLIPAYITKDEPDKLFITISDSGLVLLTYDPNFVSRSESSFSHQYPHHIQVSVGGSSKALDEVVKKLLADNRLVEIK